MHPNQTSANYTEPHKPTPESHPNHHEPHITHTPTTGQGQKKNRGGTFRREVLGNVSSPHDFGRKIIRAIPPFYCDMYCVLGCFALASLASSTTVGGRKQINPDRLSVHALSSCWPSTKLDGSKPVGTKLCYFEPVVVTDPAPLWLRIVRIPLRIRPVQAPPVASPLKPMSLEPSTMIFTSYPDPRWRK